ncbi:metal-dependent hydrolase [bacterium]|nr:metal-dependent hydrolase [bacterium]
MPSPVGHTLGALAALVAIEPGIMASRYKTNIALGASFVFGSIADADFVVAHFTSLPYLRHHYFSHSIPFAICFTILCWILLKCFNLRNAGRLAGLIGVAYSTHLLLDFFAYDGSRPYGIPLLWPFTDKHFIAPFNLFYSIRRGEFSNIFSMHNLVGVMIEIAVLTPIALLMILRARDKPSLRGT